MLTYDRGNEFARHAEFKEQTDMQVKLDEPHSP